MEAGQNGVPLESVTFLKEIVKEHDIENVIHRKILKMDYRVLDHLRRLKIVRKMNAPLMVDGRAGVNLVTVVLRVELGCRQGVENVITRIHRGEAQAA